MLFASHRHIRLSVQSMSKVSLMLHSVGDSLEIIVLVCNQKSVANVAVTGM